MASTDWNMKTFAKGASILAISAIVVKLLAAVYRVPYQNLVGDKGFYIYQQVYPFIGIFIVWTSSGFAVAVSKLLAGSARGEEKAIMRTAFFYLACVSILFFVILMGGARVIAGAMGDSDLAGLLRAGAPIVLLMPMLATLKGAFQSSGNMLPVAVSNVGEQVVRVAVILLGTWLVIRSGGSLYRAGEMAMWGAVIGQAAGVVVLALYFRKKWKGELRTIRVWSVLKELTVISISVSASSLILLLFQLVDSFTVLNMLTADGVDAELAMERKGVYDRGQPLVQMGILIASTLSLAVVPLIAHHASKKEGRGAEPFISLTFRTAFLFGTAAACGLALVLPFVNEMLFETRDGSIAIIIFVLQVFWLSLVLPMTAILQGAGKVKTPTLILLAGVLVKLIANWLLVPLLDITGASIAGNIGFALMTAALVIYFKRVFPARLAPGSFYKWTFIATLSMVILVPAWSLLADGFLFDGLPSRIASACTALTSVMIGAGTFLLITMKSRVLAEKEWYVLPFGKRLARIQMRLTTRR